MKELLLTQDRKSPNIVFMLVDNLGWGDPGCYGGGSVRMAPTPRIDQLAADGLRLTNFNVESECTPTRAALLTGRYPVRSGNHLVRTVGQTGLAPWEVTLSQLLKDRGYATACFGKWHLGNTPERHPTALGFDEWFGIQDSTGPVFDHLNGKPGTIIRHTSVWEGVAGSPAERIADYDPDARRELDGQVVERASRYITDRAADGEPFFLYLPFTQVHHPNLPHPDFDGASGNGAFADCVMEMDHRAGQVIDAIDEAGLGDDTIVVWASDNGPPSHPTLGAQGSTGPFRGCLGSAYEGQLRVPCIIRWPGTIDTGRVSDEMVSILDFYQTFASMVGAEVPTDRAVDSLDLGDFLAGGPSPREGMLCFVGKTLAAVKWHQYKLHYVEYGIEPGHRYRLELQFPQLFNVAADPREEWDLLAINLWVSEAMTPMIREFMRSVHQFPNVPTGGEGPVEGTNLDVLAGRGS